MSLERFTEVRQEAESHGIEFVDLKMLDLTGRLHHVSLPFDRFTPDVCREGVGFDGSSYGFRKVENSDMVLIPDLATAVRDPFRKRPTLSMFAEAFLTDEDRTPFTQDGRHIARAGRAGAGRRPAWPTAPSGDRSTSSTSSRPANSTPGPRRAASGSPAPSASTRTPTTPAIPFDRYDDFRDDVCRVMRDFGIPVRYHHHEVGASGQQEIEGWFADLPTTGDHAVLTKYILFNLAGSTA